MLDYLLVRLAVDADAATYAIPPTCFGFVVLGSGFGGDFEACKVFAVLLREETPANRIRGVRERETSVRRPLSMLFRNLYSSLNQTRAKRADN